jgi:N-acetylmuramoyl-L-alanine amidase
MSPRTLFSRARRTTFSRARSTKFSRARSTTFSRARSTTLRHAAIPVVIGLLAVAVTASTSGRRPTYQVRPGDTLSAIASRFHTTVGALIRLNDLPGSGNMIYAGSTLRLPGRHHHHAGRHHHATSHHHARSRGHVVHYVVRPGDSLYAIANRFHKDPAKIARGNHLPSSLVVIIGQRLHIHVRGPARHHSSGFHGVWVPSRDAVAAMIRRTSSRWRIDSRFALGISYEEAGFNQRMISGVGAIGAMQIMPATADWLARYVVQRPLNVYRARDNVTAGVAFLAVLLRETSGDMRLAAAGYYQGLTSVRNRGMFDDTKQYVANVMALRNRF